MAQLRSCLLSGEGELAPLLDGILAAVDQAEPEMLPKVFLSAVVQSCSRQRCSGAEVQR